MGDRCEPLTRPGDAAIEAIRGTVLAAGVSALALASDAARGSRAPCRRVAMVRHWGSLAMVILVMAACSEADPCLDRGGRWNTSADACEFRTGPLDTPASAIEAGRLTLEFAFGPHVLAQEPFLAELDGKVWHVHGSVPDPVRGGTAHAWLDLETGRVLRILHGQ